MEIKTLLGAVRTLKTFNALDRSGTYRIVARFHVGVPNATIEKEMRRRTKKWPKVAQDAQVVYAIAHHERNLQTYRKVMSGRF